MNMKDISAEAMIAAVRSKRDDPLYAQYLAVALRWYAKNVDKQKSKMPGAGTTVNNIAANREARHRRGRVLDFVRANPGLNYVEIAAEMGITECSSKAHLSRLKRGGHISQVRKSGRKSKYFFESEMT